MYGIQTVGKRANFIVLMNDSIKEGQVINVEKAFAFYDTDLVLKGRDRKIILNNNIARKRLTMLHVYDDSKDTNFIYVLSEKGDKFIVDQILEVKELHRSIVTRSFEYELVEVIYHK